MSSRAVQLGFILSFLLPVTIALSAHFFWKKSWWTPRYTSHGHLCSPALYCPLSEKPRVWSLAILYLEEKNEVTQNWILLPRFFPKNEIGTVEIEWNSLPEEARKTLIENNSLPQNGNVLILQDPNDFIAITFSEKIATADIIQDLKKILPKISPRRS